MNSIGTNARFQPLRGNTAREFERAVERFKKRLRLAAQRVAEGNIDLAEDLYQVAITHLYELDPARFDADDEAYLWRSMVHRMLNARRGDDRDPTRAPMALRFR